MSKEAGQKAFIALCVLLFLVGGSWFSSKLFMGLNHIPTDSVMPWYIYLYLNYYLDSPDKFVVGSLIFCTALPYAVVIALAIGIMLHKKKRALHGAARFANMQEIRKAGLISDEPRDKTILVGKFKGKYLTFAGFQFVALAAPTRSGKGVGVVIPNCLNYSDSLVVLDIKLENFDITSGFRKAHGQEVYLFAPFSETTHRYNPLHYISSEPAERLGDVDAIANAFYDDPNSKDKFFDQQAKDLFRGICLMVLEDDDIKIKSLGEILRQSSGKGKPLPEYIAEQIQQAIDKGKPYSSTCTDALNRVCSLSDNTFAGVKGSMQAKLLIFANPKVDAATSFNDFDLRDVRKKRMTIYLGITPDKLADAAPVCNLFFDQLINLNTRVLPSQDKSLKYQCLAILDEFTAIGKVNTIAKSISYQAGYNMRILTIIQNKSQLEDVYGKSGAITLLANHALMIMYAPSPTVQSDASEYSEMLGYQTVGSTSKSRSFGKNSSRSESDSEQRRALMLPQEIKELGQWREIVSLENTKPILCDKIKYFEDPDFTSRIGEKNGYSKAPVPTQNVNLFVAQIENKVRDISVEEEKEPEYEEIVGADEIDDDDLVKQSWSEMTEEQIKEYQTSPQFEKDAEQDAQAILKKIARDPIDTEQYRLNQDELFGAVNQLFDNVEDEFSLDVVEESDEEATDNPEDASKPAAMPINSTNNQVMQSFALEEESDETQTKEQSSEEVASTMDALAKFGLIDDKQDDKIA